jgi:hypothetical protein
LIVLDVSAKSRTVLWQFDPSLKLKIAVGLHAGEISDSQGSRRKTLGGRITPSVEAVLFFDRFLYRRKVAHSCVTPGYAPPEARRCVCPNPIA